MILKVDFPRLTAVFVYLLFSPFSAETVMDTRVATAELGWTAYPNSGVSWSLSTGMHPDKKKRVLFKLFLFS